MAKWKFSFKLTLLILFFTLCLALRILLFTARSANLVPVSHVFTQHARCASLIQKLLKPRLEIPAIAILKKLEPMSKLCCLLHLLSDVHTRICFQLFMFII